MRYTYGVREANPDAVPVGWCAHAPALVVPAPARAVTAQSESSAPAYAPERIESLDVLRGLMALAVVVYHLGVWTHAFAGGTRSAVIVLGIYSVEGFFIISGFCFFHLYGRAQLGRAEWWRFHIKRFFRIAPLYYLALALTLTFDPIYRLSFTWGRLIENLTLSFGLFHPNHSMVLGGWSVGLEYVFYLALPAVLWIGRRTAALYVLALVLIAWSLPFAFGKIEAAEEVRRFHVYVQLPNHAASFVLGAIVAQLRARIAFRLSTGQLLGALGVLVSIAAFAQPPVYDHLEVMIGFARLKYLALCFAVVGLCALVRWPQSSAWNRPLRWLGEASYSLYLMHPIAWLAVAQALASVDAPATRVAVGLLAALCLAAFTHRYVEVPAMDYGRKLAAFGPVAPRAAAQRRLFS